MTDQAKFRYIGTTDECTTCQQCGKPELRSTVIIMPLNADGSDDGEPTYYGSTCAARALGVKGGGRAVKQAATYARLNTLMEARDAIRMLRVYGLPLAGEPTVEEFETAVGHYADQHAKAVWAAYTPWSTWKSHTSGMLTRKQAAIAAAVLVAGENWMQDRQPIDYGYGWFS